MQSSTSLQPSKSRPTITQTRLCEVCDYDPETGNLIWKESGKKRTVGAVIGSLGSHGYLETSIDRNRYLVHRLVWLWHKGEFPVQHTDHINHIRTDNRIDNLRAVSNRENNYNQSKRTKPTTSRWRGVSWDTGRQIWKSALKSAKGYKFVGYFKEEADAAMAYNEAALQYYKEFANLNVHEENYVA